MRPLAIFFSGYAAAMFFVAALFFFRFWRASRDIFFLMFSIACVMIGLDGVVELFVAGPFDPLRSTAVEQSSWVYLIRVASFACILYGIIEKNRRHNE